MEDALACYNAPEYVTARKFRQAASTGEFLLGKPNTWQQQSAWSEHLYSNAFTLYVQDDIRVTRKLTVNMGVRFEYEGPNN